MKEPIYKVSCIVIGSKCTVMPSTSQLVDVDVCPTDSTACVLSVGRKTSKVFAVICRSRDADTALSYARDRVSLSRHPRRKLIVLSGPLKCSQVLLFMRNLGCNNVSIGFRIFVEFTAQQVLPGTRRVFIVGKSIVSQMDPRDVLPCRRGSRILQGNVQCPMGVQSI